MVFSVFLLTVSQTRTHKQKKLFAVVVALEKFLFAFVFRTLPFWSIVKENCLVNTIERDLNDLMKCLPAFSLPSCLSM